MKKILDWFDSRTGVRDLMHEALYERIPGGARWRYVWGSTLVFTFFLQVVTGFMLWSAYSPSAATAWESVYYIQYEMTLGWLVRGIHHFAAQAMVVLMAIHLMQVIIDGAYKAPREINFWLGLILMQIVLGLSLTGYLLPWDQKGYYATRVATNIAAATPWVGQQIQQVVQGGAEYGHHTLTRFFALHAGILPALLVAFLGLHIAVFRKHGITVPDPEKAPETTFWPDQVLKDGVACLAVLATVMALSIWKGAELSAPADPSEGFSAARPEWYFLFLFRFLKFEFIDKLGLAFGAIYIPGILMGILAAMPIIAYKKRGHAFNVAFSIGMIVIITILTGVAMYEDNNSKDFQLAINAAHNDAARVRELAQAQGIPVSGALSLLQNDPLRQGPTIYKNYCATCHHYNGTNGLGDTPESNATAADLGNFGSRAWFRSILLNYDDHFGPIRQGAWYDEEAEKQKGEDGEGHFLHGPMSEFINTHKQSLGAEQNADKLDALIEFLVHQSARDEVEPDEAEIATGQELFADLAPFDENLEFESCANCHSLIPRGQTENLGDGAPSLTGYGSKEWLRDFIANPQQEEHYGENSPMPAFEKQLSPEELELLVRWLVKDYVKPKKAENHD